MTLNQKQTETLFNAIPGDEALIRVKADKVCVHFYKVAEVVMTLIEFDSYTDALDHFNSSSIH